MMTFLKLLRLADYKNPYFSNDLNTSSDFRKKYNLDTLVENLNSLNSKYTNSEKKKVKINAQ